MINFKPQCIYLYVSEFVLQEKTIKLIFLLTHTSKMSNVAFLFYTENLLKNLIIIYYFYISLKKLIETFQQIKLYQTI